jgi:hypothetical protein
VFQRENALKVEAGAGAGAKAEKCNKTPIFRFAITSQIIIQIPN